MRTRGAATGARGLRAERRTTGALTVWLALLALALAAAAPGAGRAQPVTAPAAQPAAPTSSELPTAARQIYEGVMSPFCPGLLLANCPSPQADSLRRAVAARAAAGETRAQLEADLLATYGDAVRAAPAGRGFGLVAWATPGVLLAVGAGWLTHGLARRRPAASQLQVALGAGADARAGGGADATAAERAALDALLLHA